MDADPRSHDTSALLRTQIVPRRAQAELAVAREIAALIRADADVGRATTLGLATGGTMTGVYAELVRMHRQEGLSFATVTTFNLDEYSGLAPDHPASFRSAMQRCLFAHVDLDPARTFVPDGRVPRSGVDAYCRQWEEAIQSAGGLDLQLCGIGRNGHVAFNEPGAAGDSRTRLVELHSATRADAASMFGALSDVPTHAITAGIATVLDARRLRMLAFGAHKADIVRRALTDAVGPELPATWLRGHADAEVWLDDEAAAALEREVLE